jgi:site-specific DNA-methyltransferase (adenine-specific)
MKRFELHHGDCLEVLRTLPDASVDAVVTDPPYGILFMNKKWDYDVPSVEVWEQCLRVLKPGGHLLCFAGTRTHHRMACRIEDAGFEIRDMIAWLYGSGFPKSHNLDGEHEGWGTALKPAMEPLTVARKPFRGTVAANVAEHGTGAINVDGCRVGADGGTKKANIRKGEPNGERAGTSMGVQISFRCGVSNLNAGRWPANVIHDGSEEVLAGFPESKSTGGQASLGAFRGGDIYGKGRDERESKDPGYGDSGSAARFFYCAKASKRDRDDGCANLAQRQYSHDGRSTPIDNAYQRNSSSSSNHHPTVKPTDLMKYLCRLITPLDGVVLDPFTGSGSTGKAAMLEGFRFIGIEREAEYIEIARARIEAATRKQLKFEFN